MVKISIVVPVYNVPEQYLKKCLNSLIEQTYKNIEIIVVDDGSTDLSSTVCDEYSEKDSRLNVIHKKNGGLSAARNTGVENAHGAWVMFVDGDDWIAPQMCEHMINVAEKESVDLVMCGMVKEYSRNSYPYKYNLEEKVYEGKECKYLQELLLHYNSNIAVAYCKLISRSLLIENSIMHNSELRQGAEGLEFNIRLFEVVKSAYFINKCYYHYVYNDNSISASHNENNHRFVINCFRKIKKQINESPNRENLLHWFNNRVLYIILTTAISGYFSPSNKENYKEKKRKYIEYLEQDIVKEALYSKDYQELSKTRRLTLTLIKHRMFLAVQFIAIVRRMQKQIS